MMLIQLVWFYVFLLYLILFNWKDEVALKAIILYVVKSKERNLKVLSSLWKQFCVFFSGGEAIVKN